MKATLKKAFNSFFISKSLASSVDNKYKKVIPKENMSDSLETPFN
ncbi:hypothetical protein NIES4071_72960 [Calothrix sp. NIES-4071]|nr:hypothetical protein NIES4071_72960 [Calothrix sp. NIES-4071]BAZ61571.1 hypothetical protein NIES4105_72910 [Calothrix sp. NIES-4105]